MDRASQPYLRGDLVIVIDCSDLGRAAEFWSAVLGYDAEEEGVTYRTLRPRDGHGIEILLQRTADAKVAKNRLHLDLRTRNLDEEVRRVTDLGATLLTEPQAPVRECGWTWHVLADQDGNEFCVLRPPDTYWTNR